MGRDIVCNECSAMFKLDSVKVETEALTENRVGLFFDCPVCGAKYPFAGLTKRGKEIVDLLGDLRKQIGLVKKPAFKKNLMNRQRTLLKEYESEVTGPYKEEEVLI